MSRCPALPLRYLCALPFVFAGVLFAQDGSAVAPVADPEPAVVAAPIPAIKPPDKRVFGVLPNYRTAEDTGIYTPISARHKMYIAYKDTFDYPLFYIAGALTGLAQASDEHPDFGQGVKGFAHRYVTSYADQMMGNFLTEGALPVLFHEDPRYFRKGAGHGSAGYRAWYAATRILITKTDSGRSSFNFAEITGNSIAAAVGNSYYPGETHLGDNLGRLGVALATDAASQVLKEFWPDLKQKFFSHRKRSAASLDLSSSAAQ